MAACPNRNSEEWRYLVELAGEETAYKVFMANGDRVPSMGESTRIVAQLNTERLQNITPTAKRVMDEHKLIADPDTAADNTYRKGANRYGRLTEKLVPKFMNRKTLDEGETPGERKAKNVWDRWGHPADKKIDFGDGDPLNREEFAKKWDQIAETSRVKGTILHGLFQMLFESDPAKKQDIANRLSEIGEKVGIADIKQTFGWLLKTNKAGEFDVARRILSISGINALENMDPQYKDKVHSEVKVVNDDLGIGTSIDTLVEHADGYFSIVEWKTGKSFPNKFYNRLMKYGDQTIDITDNPREHAKLQIMLQAVMLKAAHPEMQFRNLRVHWIPNEFRATMDDVFKDVEVHDYLNMVKQFLKNEMPDAYNEMVKKSPRIFDEAEYGAPPVKIVDQLLESRDDIDVFIRKKMDELSYLRNHNPNGKNNHKITRLASEITTLVQDNNVNLTLNGDGILNATEADALSMYKRAVGHTGSISSPVVQTWARFFKNRKSKVHDEVETLNKKFKALVEPIKREYYDQNVGKGMINTVTGRKINMINHDQFYNFMWKGPRFVTKNDQEYGMLTPNQKRLVDFVNEHIHKELSATMNKVAYETPGKKGITFLDIYRQQNGGFEIFEGFAPKVPTTATEILKREGLGKKYTQKIKDSYRQRLTEQLYDHNREQHGLSIKYLGSPEIDASDNYTRNVEVIFDVFMRGLKNKQHLDDVYHLGYGLRDVLALKEYADGEKVYEDTMKFIENRIVSDVMGKRKTMNWSNKAFRTSKDTNVSIDQIIRQIKHKVGWTVMWVKPISGTANGLFTWLVNLKESVVGTIGESFHGIEGRAIDFTVKDFTQAHKDWSEMQKDAVLGKIRENKVYLVARKIKYLPDNFDFANRTDEYSTKSNPILEESSLYAAHTIWEEWVAELLMVSMMRRMKLKDGRSVWDAYEVQDVTGEDGITYKDVVWNGGIRGVIKKQVGNQTVYENLEGLTWREIEHMKRIYERIHGAYRKEERTSLELYAMGEAVMQYKKYMPSILNNLFDSRRKETYLGEWKKVGVQEVRGKQEDVYEWVARVNEGRARVFYKFLAATSGMHKLFSADTADKYKGYRWSELSNEQKLGLVNMYTTGAMYMLMLAGYFAMFREEDDKNSYKRLTKRIIDNFSQQYNPVDLLRTMRNPLPIFAKTFNTIQGTGELMLASSFYLAGDRDPGGMALTQKGDLRGWNSMQKNIPGLSSRYDIVKFLENALEDTDSHLHWNFKNPLVIGGKKD